MSRFTKLYSKRLFLFEFFKKQEDTQSTAKKPYSNFLSGSENAAILNEGCRTVMIVGREAQNIELSFQNRV